MAGTVRYVRMYRFVLAGLLLVGCAPGRAAPGTIASPEPAPTPLQAQAAIPADEVCVESRPRAAVPAGLQAAVLRHDGLTCVDGVMRSFAADDSTAFVSFVDSSHTEQRGGTWLLEVDGDVDQERLTKARTFAHLAVDPRGRLHAVIAPYEGYSDALEYRYKGDSETWPQPPIEGHLASIAVGPDGQVVTLTTGPGGEVVGSYDGSQWSTRVLSDSRISLAAFDAGGALWSWNERGELVRGSKRLDLPPIMRLRGFTTGALAIGVEDDAKQQLTVIRLSTGERIALPAPPPVRELPAPAGSLRAERTTDEWVFVGETQKDAWIVLERTIADIETTPFDKCPKSDGTKRPRPGPMCHGNPVTADRTRREALIYRVTRDAVRLAATVPLASGNGAFPWEVLFADSHEDVLTLAWGTVHASIEILALDVTKLD